MIYALTQLLILTAMVFVPAFLIAGIILAYKDSK